ALLIETSTLPVQAPSIRTWETRLPSSSTTAMFIGWPSSCARRSPAAITLRASASDRITVPPQLPPAGPLPRRRRRRVGRNAQLTTLGPATRRGRARHVAHLSAARDVRLARVGGRGRADPSY